MKRADLIEREKHLLRKTLDKTGVTALRQRGVKGKRPDFPDLRINPRYNTSDNPIYTPTRPHSSQHPDAMQFPVGHLHKQGTVLITSTKPEDLQWYGGKKS